MSYRLLMFLPCRAVASLSQRVTVDRKVDRNITDNQVIRIGCFARCLAKFVRSSPQLTDMKDSVLVIDFHRSPCSHDRHSEECVGSTRVLLMSVAKCSQFAFIDETREDPHQVLCGLHDKTVQPNTVTNTASFGVEILTGGSCRRRDLGFLVTKATEHLVR